MVTTENRVIVTRQSHADSYRMSGGNAGYKQVGLITDDFCSNMAYVSVETRILLKNTTIPGT